MAVNTDREAMNDMLADDPLGPSLASIAERDIDLLLLEEFNASEAFLKWFCSQVGVPEAELMRAWHSVANAFGESDLVLTVQSNGKIVGILIENKIDAPEQKEQGTRYRSRGDQYVKEGLMQSYVTVMCAPETYISSLPESSGYDRYLHYEKICDWFNQFEDRRSKWRSYVIESAATQAKRGYKMVVNQKKTEFHRKYWEYLRSKYPYMIMAEPTNRGNMSNWIIIRVGGFPKGVHLHHKFTPRTVELGFVGRSAEELHAKRDRWDNGQIYLQQKGKTAALVRNVPFIDLTIDFSSQLDAVDEALQAAIQLMPFATLLDDAETMPNPAPNGTGTPSSRDHATELSRLEKLLPFLDQFERPDFTFAHFRPGRPASPGRIGEIGSFTMTDSALAFIKAAYEADCVEEFDWTRWSETDHARKLLADPPQIDHADASTLIRLLTVYLRKDRFVDGALAKAFDQGALTRILRRAKTLAARSPADGAA